MDTLKAKAALVTDNCVEKFRKSIAQSKGFTLLEMMVVLSMIGIITGMAAYQLKQLDNPAQTSAAEVMTFLKKSRAKALASTYAYRVRPKSNSTELETHYAISCSSTTFTLDSNLSLQLPDTASFGSNSWSLCFEPRGTLATSQDILISDPKQSVTVQVAMGGGMRKI